MCSTSETGTALSKCDPIPNQSKGIGKTGKTWLCALHTTLEYIPVSCKEREDVGAVIIFGSFKQITEPTFPLGMDAAVTGRILGRGNGDSGKYQLTVKHDSAREEGNFVASL